MGERNKRLAMDKAEMHKKYISDPELNLKMALEFYGIKFVFKYPMWDNGYYTVVDFYLKPKVGTPMAILVESKRSKRNRTWLRKRKGIRAEIVSAGMIMNDIESIILSIVREKVKYTNFNEVSKLISVTQGRII